MALLCSSQMQEKLAWSPHSSSNETTIKKQGWRDFPGGPGVGNPPANAGDTGLSPGRGGSHMPRSN